MPLDPPPSPMLDVGPLCLLALAISATYVTVRHTHTALSRVAIRSLNITCIARRFVHGVRRSR